jgi:hypothetical protein
MCHAYFNVINDRAILQQQLLAGPSINANS